MHVHKIGPDSLQDGSGDTALYVSSQGHRGVITRLLLERGANMNILGDMTVNSFMFAIVRKSLV